MYRFVWPRAVLRWAKHDKQGEDLFDTEGLFIFHFLLSCVSYPYSSPPLHKLC